MFGPGNDPEAVEFAHVEVAEYAWLDHQLAGGTGDGLGFYDLHSQKSLIDRI